MSRKVSSVSFLVDGTRRIIEVNASGKMSFSHIETVGSKSKIVRENFFPRDFVRHYVVREKDPVLTLENGEKYRVYQGGDSTYMLVEVESILDLHESLFKKKMETEYAGSHVDMFEDLGGW